MIKLLKDVTTGQDNETHEVVRTSMAVIIAMLPFVMLWGLAMKTWGFYIGKDFDLAGSFHAVLDFLIGAGSFLTGGGLAIFFKSKNNPDGTESETSSITTSSVTKGP